MGEMDTPTKPTKSDEQTQTGWLGWACLKIGDPLAGCGRAAELDPSAATRSTCAGAFPRAGVSRFYLRGSAQKRSLYEAQGDHCSLGTPTRPQNLNPRWTEAEAELQCADSEACHGEETGWFLYLVTRGH